MKKIVCPGKYLLLAFLYPLLITMSAFFVKDIANFHKGRGSGQLHLAESHREMVLGSFNLAFNQNPNSSSADWDGYLCPLVLEDSVKKSSARDLKQSSARDSKSSANKIVVADPLSDSTMIVSKQALKRQRQKDRRSFDPNDVGSSWMKVDDNSQANGFTDNKNKTDRSKQERIRRPAKLPTEPKKKKGWPEPMDRPTVEPWIPQDGPLPHRLTPVVARDSSQEQSTMVQTSTGSRSLTGSSTSSMASSSTTSEDVFCHVARPGSPCQSESSHSSSGESAPKGAALQGQSSRTVARLLEAIQIVSAASRGEVQPTRPVRVEGGNSMNLTGLGCDPSNPNWNWCSTQNHWKMMEDLRRDKSDADRAEEDNMDEDLHLSFEGDGKNSLQHAGPIYIDSAQMASLLLLQRTRPEHKNHKSVSQMDDCIPLKGLL